MTEKHDENYGKAWYSLEGMDGDVVVSTRVRISRNLANFPFPARFKGDDAERVQSIIMDAFQNVKNPDDFHSIAASSLGELNRRVLEERGVLKPIEEVRARVLPIEAQVLLNQDGNTSAVVNSSDHLKIASFSSGLDFRKCFDSVKALDDELQETLQFAGSHDFGYLTCAMKDAGSGMKLSARISLPASVKFSRMQPVMDFLSEKKIAVFPAFPPLAKINSPPAGSFFLLANAFSNRGSEIDQIAEMEAACKFIAEYERKILTEFADNQMTIARNSVLRAYSISNMSLLVSLREAVDVVSDLLLGVRLDMVCGIDCRGLCALLYRIQDGHLSYLMENGGFDFEEDVRNDRRLRLDRLRALTLQEALENVSLRKI